MTVPGSNGPALVALANDVQGGNGLWHWDLTTGWTTIVPLANATAIARFGDQVVVARAGGIEARSLANLAKAGSTSHPSWKPSAPLAPIVFLDRSPTGTVAVACQDTQSEAYGVINQDGTAALINPEPAAAFSPQVSWLDTNRLLVMNTDAALVSRLSVFDVEGQSLRDLNGIGGVRAFALSGDRLTVAVATQNNVYLGTVAEVLDGAVPKSTLPLAKTQVVWDMALDASGARLAMLSGIVAANGTVGSMKELVYFNVGGVWTVQSSLGVPFTAAVGQVWIS